MRIELELREFRSYHACMVISSNFELDFKEFSHACAPFVFVLRVQHVFVLNISFEQVLKASKPRYFIHVMFMIYQV